MDVPEPGGSSGHRIAWRVLGPIGVRTADGWVSVGAPKMRALLAALLADPGRIVSTERLIDELWGEDPPGGARKLVSQYVLRLRRILADPAGRVLVTAAPGYRLAATPHEVDAGRFQDLAATARLALQEREASRAAELCQQALALWQGQALADVPRGPMAIAVADRLEELRLATLELQMEARLRCGSAVEVVVDLRQLTGSYPLRERFWQLLMRALESCGRPAEALAAFAQASEVIAEELGADPGPDLQQLHRRLLAGDAASTPPGSAVAGVDAAAPPRADVVPRQLPGAVANFAGRTAELEQLSLLLEDPARTSNAIVISAIGGTAGVGKTALALQWAHQVADRFPDGQLYVNLRGYDASDPMPATDALARFVRALGGAAQMIPVEEDERAAMYRSLLAGKRMLILLDNAGDVAQVRPLLPGTPSCATLVTSRDSLTGLVAGNGARRLELDLLPESDAAGLLAVLIGERAVADPTALIALVAQCARLPLALRVAAELAVSRPAVPLAELVAQLSDEGRRLELLETGSDQRTAVRAVFSWSYQHLSASAAQVFRLLGLHPGPDLDRHATAALSGTSIEAAGNALSQLERAHLIHMCRAGRYGMHDLLRAYAADQAMAFDSEQQRQQALTRVLEYYLYTAAAAMNTLFPEEAHRRPPIPEPVTPVPAVSNEAAAREWLDTHLATLVAVTRSSIARGRAGYAAGISAIVAPYLGRGGHHAEARTIHGCALQAARQACDRAAEAAALVRLAVLGWRVGSYQPAAAQARDALEIFLATGDVAGQAEALTTLSLVDAAEGRLEQAASHLRWVQSLSRDLGDRIGETRTLANLGVIEGLRGNYDRSNVHFRQALAQFRQIGDRSGEARAFENLGDNCRRLRRYEQAAANFLQALATFRELGERPGAASVLAHLGDVRTEQNRLEEAVSHYQEAVVLFRATGDMPGEAQALKSLGEIWTRLGQADKADEVRARLAGLRPA